MYNYNKVKLLYINNMISILKILPVRIYLLCNIVLYDSREQREAKVKCNNKQINIIK
jgi:hypothetical protein